MPSALVTGGNKGIGYEACRLLKKEGLDVILTARDKKRGGAAAKKLGVEFCQLDVTDERSIKKCVDHVKKAHKELDVLVNNAGILLDWDTDMVGGDIDIARKTMETNAFAPLRVSQLFLPLLKKSEQGRIIMVSSGAGHLPSEFSGLATYRISKAALNMVTSGLSHDLIKDNILVNAMSPGWCKTDMGGKGATRTAAEGADTIVWLATECKKTGGMYQDRRQIGW